MLEYTKNFSGARGCRYEYIGIITTAVIVKVKSRIVNK